MFKWWASLRARLVGLLLMVVFPLVALTLYSGYEQRLLAAEAVQSDALSLARVAALNQEFLLEQARGFLLALSHTVGSDLETIRNCQDIFAHLADEHFFQYTGFFVADLEANLLCHTPGETPLIKHCEHYKQLIRSQNFLMSDYHLCKNTGEGTVSLGYPIYDEQGQMIGVVNAGIDLVWFNKLAEDATLPEGSNLVVFNDDYTILAHYPPTKVWMGKKIIEDPLTTYMLQNIEGVTEGVGFDGVERLYGFVPLWQGDQTVILAVGIPPDVAYGPVNRSTWFNLALIAVITSLALVLAWRVGNVYIVRPTQAIVATTHRLAAGDLQARSGVSSHQGELGNLAQAVDQLGQALLENEIQRSQAEEAIRAYAADLELTNRELQDFNSLASHDLQEPVRKLQVYSSLLLRRYQGELDEEAQRYLHSLNNGAGRMQRLVQDLQHYSQILTRAQPFQALGLDQVLRDVLEDLEARIAETGAQIQVDPLPQIEGDALQMHRLFLNLLQNALKFHRPGVAPQVHVYANLPAGGAQSANGKVEIHVADHGIGFDEKYLERIFQPFESLHKTGEYPGTGMGLAICRKIVERHGGTITARSRPGESADFIVSLPLRQSEGGS